MDLYEIHKSDPGIFSRLTLRNQLFFYYHCPQLEQIIQLYSKHNILVFTLSGSRIIHHGDKKWISNRNHGLLLKRGAFAQELPSDYSGWEVIVIHLKDGYLKKVFEEFRPYLRSEDLQKEDVEMLEEFAISDETRNCYESLIPYFSNPQTLPDTILEGKFKELLFLILSNPSNGHILAYINQIVDDYRKPIWEVMESNYFYNLNISEFAEIAKMSTATFRREFKDYYKTTPGKWLTTRRLEKATTLLKTTNKTVSEITFDCGFKNLSHFSRIFKEKLKLSPKDYRLLDKESSSST